MPKRMTLETLLVLRELFDALPECEVFGLQVARATGLEPGTIYPILARLERDGWVERRKEAGQIASRAKRPARFYYRLTSAGAIEASAALTRGERKLAAVRAAASPPLHRDPVISSAPHTAGDR